MERAEETKSMELEKGRPSAGTTMPAVVGGQGGTSSVKDRSTVLMRLLLILLTGLAVAFLGLFVWQERGNSRLKETNANLRARVPPDEFYGGLASYSTGCFNGTTIFPSAWVNYKGFMPRIPSRCMNVVCSEYNHTARIIEAENVTYTLFAERDCREVIYSGNEGNFKPLRPFRSFRVFYDLPLKPWRR